MVNHSICKTLIKFSFKQLINFNIHVGIKTDFWVPLNYNLIFGIRQNHFFLNLNLTIINLRYTLNLIKFLLSKNYNLLFYNSNLILSDLLFKNYKLMRLLNLYFGLGKWVNGFLTNFKSFRIQINKLVLYLFKSGKKKILKNFFKYNVKKIWNFILFLRKMKLLPSGNIIFDSNDFAILETFKLNMFSVSLLDVNKNESILLSCHYLIPFNFLNFSSVLFFYKMIRSTIFITLIKRKIFFFSLLIFILKFKLLKKFKMINLIYSFFINLFFIKNKTNINISNIINLFFYKKINL